MEKSNTNFHRQLGFVVNEYEQYYPNIPRFTIYKKFLHLAHTLLSREIADHINVAQRVREILMHYHKGKSIILQTKGTYRSNSSKNVLVIEENYSKPTIFVVINEENFPISALTLEHFQQDEPLFQIAIESKLFNKKQWMKDLKKQKGIK